MPQYDLAIIGGGLAGAATAYYACKRGASVLLLERRDLNLGASGSNAGSIHAQIPFDPFSNLGPEWARRYAATLPLFQASIRQWGGLEDELQGHLGLSAKGGLMVAATEGDCAALRAKVEIERAAGLDVDLWDKDALDRKAPFLASGMKLGAFCGIEGKADPFAVAPLYAKRAIALGLDLRRNADVVAISAGQDGFTLKASQADFTARRVVNAAGADAARVAAMAGIHVEIEAHAIQVSVTEKRPQTLPYLLYFTGEKLTLKQSAEGGFLIGGGWPARLKGYPVVDQRSMIRNLSIAQEVVPALHGVDIVRSWAAMVNGTADWRPILGEAPEVPGFYLNLFPWMGFTAAPAVSEAIAALALGETPAVDLRGFGL
ncbi:NAD(P)/FAD-dependent oxidoreductase [Pseudaestuariivita sp.]|uniref:NAD(P)/FAD-dependent oxidoreductase n=1 Tax=Pseudaestuariivita sp. TaxID=2211669 RepID=UPI0040586C7B